MVRTYRKLKRHQIAPADDPRDHPAQPPRLTSVRSLERYANRLIEEGMDCEDQALRDGTHSGLEKAERCYAKAELAQRLANLQTPGRAL